LGRSTFFYGAAVFLTSTGASTVFAAVTGPALRASSTSARIILPAGPVPLIDTTSSPFSVAVFLASGLINTLSPEVDDVF
jgi:hypothetical protein